jgi:DNA-binding beta-propeller fold protein YncE
MDGGSTNDLERKAPKSDQQDDRASKRPRGESHGILLQQASDEYYDAEADEEDVRTEVTTGDGKTHKNTLPAKSTVLKLKQRLAHDAGFKPQQTRLFVNDDSREEELEEEEGLGSLRRGKGLAVLIMMMLEEADAQEVVPRLAAEADLVLGDGTEGSGDSQIHRPYGVAFVPAHPDWVVTAEINGDRVKISNIHTGALICKYGEIGSGEGQFSRAYGVAVTSDSSFIIVSDHCHARVKVLRLVVAADRSSVHLEFVRNVGNYLETGEGQLQAPFDVALLPGKGGGQETVLVTDIRNHRVLQFKLDGTFIRMFAGTAGVDGGVGVGTGIEGQGDGEFNAPHGITVLGSSGEVAVADSNNHRVQIFDHEGNYKRQFGSEGQQQPYFGEEADGQFICPSALASDVHDNLLVLDRTDRLQVFSPEGKHLCTRNDLGFHKGSIKGIAWSDVGKIAVADGYGHKMLLWHKM